MQHTKLFWLLNVMVVAASAAITGKIGLDANISSSSSSGPSGTPDRPRGPGLFGSLVSAFGASLPTLPNITDLVSHLPDGANASSVVVPPIPGLSPLTSLPAIPGLASAIQEARDHAATALGIGNNFVDGIQRAIEQAFASNDPTGAVRTLVNTILDAYLAVAENCPMIVIAARVLQEGIRLAGEVIMSARNVILGPSA